MNVIPYLNFDGEAEEAMTFYKSVLGGEFEGGVSYFGDAPGMELPESEKKLAMNISLKVSDQVTIMASDVAPSMGHSLTQGNHIYVSLAPDSKAEGERIFRELSEGGRIEMNYEKTFWGAYFGSFVDKYGIGWMINYTLAPGEE
jgi:PhnB protein